MSHARQQIREAIESALSGIAGVTVFSSRQTEKYDEANLPAITINTLTERLLADSQSINDLESDRELILTIEIRGKEVTGIDDALDDIAVSIEDILGAGETWDIDGSGGGGPGPGPGNGPGQGPSDGPGWLKFIQLQGTDVEIDDGSLDRPVGLMTLTYVLVYRVSSADVETIL